MFFCGSGCINSYENRAVSLRTSEILSQAKILANQIVSNDYLENSGSPTINAQLEQLSTIYDGRVMIISDTFQVVKDTYKLDEKKTIISEEVIKSFYLGRRLRNMIQNIVILSDNTTCAHGSGK